MEKSWPQGAGFHTRNQSKSNQTQDPPSFRTRYMLFHGQQYSPVCQFQHGPGDWYQQQTHEPNQRALMVANQSTTACEENNYNKCQISHPSNKTHLFYGISGTLRTVMDTVFMPRSNLVLCLEMTLWHCFV